jgi:3-hydroxybutyryl-CoA dehydrogenase
MTHPPRIESVAVIGGGFMGSGIAECVATAGIPVVIREPDRPAAERARERVKNSIRKRVERGRLSSEQSVEIVERIDVTDDLSCVGGMDLVIEAVPEDISVKREVMNAIGDLATEKALIASNTSSIPIAELARAIPVPERVLGLHFFSPVPAMKLVEIVRALDTSDQTVEAAQTFCRAIGKAPIETKDRSGFIVNMLLVPYLMASVRMYEEGFASPEDIDLGMRFGCGHPMGPLALCDLIGLDVLYAVCESLYDEFKRDEYAPPPLMKRMVASGRLGRKSGRGFYDYASEVAPASGAEGASPAMGRG